MNTFFRPPGVERCRNQFRHFPCCDLKAGGLQYGIIISIFIMIMIVIIIVFIIIICIIIFPAVTSRQAG